MKPLILIIQFLSLMDWFSLNGCQNNEGFDEKKIPYNCGEKNILSRVIKQTLKIFFSSFIIKIRELLPGTDFGQMALSITIFHPHSIVG